MTDIEPGCEPVVAQLRRWTEGLMAGEVDVLEDILAPEFRFSTGPDMPGDQMNKPQFIEMDRKVRNCSIEFLSIVARRMDAVVSTLCHAQVALDFAGDAGSALPGTTDVSASMKPARLCYASAWRQDDAGQWQCFSHHVLGHSN